jgi:hypothetical protein
MKVHHIAGPGDTIANVTMRADATMTEAADVRTISRRSGLNGSFDTGRKDGAILMGASLRR